MQINTQNKAWYKNSSFRYKLVEIGTLSAYFLNRHLGLCVIATVY